MKAWPVVPGVPAAGHVTAGGYWHPGKAEGCAKCEPPPRRCWPCNGLGYVWGKGHVQQPCTACKGTGKLGV